MAAPKKIEIIYDVNGKAIDVAIDKTLNLQQAAKALTAELRRTKEGSDEFAVLSRKLGETQDGLAKTSAKSKDLFTSLSLLPGPVGQFFQELSQSLELLKLFSSFSLKDISFQIGEVADDIGDVGKNLVGLNEVQEINTATTEAQATAQAELATATQTATVATAEQTAAVEAETVATETATVATTGLSVALKALGIGAIIALVAALVVYWDDLKDAILGTSDATRAFNAVNSKAAENGAEQIAQLKTLGGLMQQTNNTQYEKNKAVNDYNDKLGATLGYVKSWGELEEKLKGKLPEYIKYLELKSRAEAAYQLSIEASKKAIQEGAKSPQEAAKWYDYLASYTIYASAGANRALEHLGKERIKNAVGESETLAKTYLNTFNTVKQEADKLGQSLGIAAPKIKDIPGAEKPKELQDKELLAKAKKYEEDLTAIKKEEGAKREKQEIDNAAAAEVRELQALNISKENEKKRTDAIANVYAIAQKKKNEVDAKYEEKRQEERKAVLEKIAEMEVKAIKDQGEQQKKERLNQWEKEKKDLKEALDKNLITKKEYDAALIASEKSKNIAIAAITEQALKDEYDKRQKAYDDELKKLQIKGEVLTKLTQEYYDNKKLIIDTALKKDIETAEEAARQEKAKKEGDAEAIAKIEKELQDKILGLRKKAQEDKKKINELELNDYLEAGTKILGAVNSIYAQQAEINQMRMQRELQAVKGNAEEEDKIKKKYFEKNKQTQIAQATIGMLQGAIQAYQALAVIPIVGPALGIAAAAAVLIYGAQKINEIKQQQYESSLTTAATTAPPTPAKGKNYGDGGMIDGPRHAQGGVMINAEGGEAVMTRGAVTMFGPLLSALNQAGGGTSFTKGVTTTGYDNPKSAFPSDYIQQPAQIIKSYVVEGELTSQQQKQARLKDLSTI